MQACMMDRWTDGQMDRWTDGWTNKRIFNPVSYRTLALWGHCPKRAQDPIYPKNPVYLKNLEIFI